MNGAKGIQPYILAWTRAYTCTELRNTEERHGENSRADLELPHKVAHAFLERICDADSKARRYLERMVHFAALKQARVGILS